VDVVNRSLERLEEMLDVVPGEISGYVYDAVVVGNSTMRSIFCGQDPSTLGVLPFEPAERGPVLLDARTAGLDINPAASPEPRNGCTLRPPPGAQGPNVQPCVIE